MGMLKLPTFLLARGPTVVRPATPALHFTPMFAFHVPEVVSIDRRLSTTPWSDARFNRAKAKFDRSGTVALLAGSGRIVGYAVVAIDRPESTVRVLRFGVDVDMQRRGIGRELFANLVDDAASDGMHIVECACPEQLFAAIKFLAGIGFRGEGVRRGEDGEADCWVFQRKIETICTGK